MNDDFVHRFVPGSAGSSAPVLLLLHGTGGDENSLLDLGRSVYPGAPLLSPRGRVLEQGMPRFFRRLAEGIFDEPDLIHRAHELADFVGAAATRYGFDPRRVVALGYSNGANIAATALLLRPGTLAGAVLLRAMTPLKPAQPPDLAGVPVLLAAGRHDPLVPASNIEALAAMLRDAGASTTLRWSDAGHQLTLPEIDAARRWLVANFPA
jgi:predicted esterase